MGETAPTAPTADITDHDLETEAQVRLAMYEGRVDRLLAAIRESREAGFAAGLEERADEAHAAGYAEGLADGIAKGRASALAGLAEFADDLDLDPYATKRHDAIVDRLVECGLER